MRSLLLVSGERPDSLHSLARAGADALVFDLTRRAETDGTREALDRVAAFRTTSGDKRSSELYVRVDGFAREFVGLDLETAMPARPDGILLMDAVGGRDISRLGAILAVHEAELGLEDGSTRIIATISSARGVLAVGSLAGVSRRLAGIAWDADALRADLGGQSARDEAGAYADPYRVARSMTLLAAAASNLRAVDTAHDGGEPDGLAEDCRAARRDGFPAKLALDPAHIPIINAAFAPRLL